MLRKMRIASVNSRAMCASSAYVLIRPSRLLLLAVVIGLWFGSEQKCQASCGDYLVHHGDRQTLLTKHGDTGLPKQNPVSPCRGANCSRRSEVPPLPTRPTVETSISVEWACLLQQIRDQDDESSKWSLESDRVLARHTSHRLKRPPRA